MKRVAYIAGIILWGVLFSCQSADQNEIEIIGQTWILSSIVSSDGSMVDIQGLTSLQDEYWIVLDDNGGINAQLACNTCSGEYEFGDDSTIWVTGFSCTESGCSGTAYFFLLDDHYSYSLDGERLRLTELRPQPGSQYIFITDSE